MCWSWPDGEESVIMVSQEALLCIAIPRRMRQLMRNMFVSVDRYTEDHGRHTSGPPQAKRGQGGGSDDPGL